ncbi:putative membrane protein, partial [Escherichia coli 97.0010]
MDKAVLLNKILVFYLYLFIVIIVLHKYFTIN